MNVSAIIRLLLTCSLLVGPATAWAQSASTAALAGIARDTTGAVLPGVTVEAASPALIEKVRVVTTDDQGNYKIFDLRPGKYTVTFTLPGFSTFKREDLELTTGFTATVNAEMRIGSLEETVTVTGASPVVDVQNVRQQAVFRKDIQEALPLGRNLAQWATIIPGATLNNASFQDVGGLSTKSSRMLMHGIGDTSMGRMIDGMSYSSDASSGGSAFSIDAGALEEVTFQTSGLTAETQYGSLQVNMVPREGGNRFKVYASGDYMRGSWQANNITPELIARGAAGAGALIEQQSLNVAGGGPIKRNRLWFYTAVDGAAGKRYQPGNYFNKTQDSWLYTPDLTRQAATDDHNSSRQLRLTWQVSQKNKVNFHGFMPHDCQCYFLSTATQSPEAAPRIDQRSPMMQATWSFPVTNRLLFEAGAQVLLHTSEKMPQPGANGISVLESSTNFRYRSNATAYSATSAWGKDESNQANERFSISNITGSHAFKVGLNARQGWIIDITEIPSDIAYTFRNGVPLSVTVFASPGFDKERSRDLGIYAQDQWTISRLTLNLGARLDTFRGYVPDQRLQAGTYVPARDFKRVDNIPNWKNVSPRFGAAYDVFGNGHTAVKVLLGRYVDFANTATIVTPNNPALTMVTNATRTWTDANGDFIPQPAELGPLSNAAFGTTNPTTRFDDSVLRGWSARGYNWQTSAQIQQQLWPGTAVNIGYFRTWFGNFLATDNLATVPGDFNPYCLTTPADSRLPGGGGQQLCGLYDIAPAKFGLVNNLITQVSDFGKQTQVFNGVDATISMRLGGGATVTGGLSTGATVTDNCAAIVDSPQKQFCRVSPPWSAGTQVKFGVIYPLPWSFRASTVFQNLPGIPRTANYVATNAQILPSLGRNLGQCRGAATCNGTTTVELIQPQTMFEDRLTQVDVRLTRIFQFRRARVQGNFDVFNLFNASSVLAINTRYGPSWLQPTVVLGGRVARLGFQLDM